MIESPAGVAAAREILSVPGLDGTMVGTADLRASSTATDPDPAESLRTVHRVVADLERLRMDIVNDLDAARRSYADWAIPAIARRFFDAAEAESRFPYHFAELAGRGDHRRHEQRGGERRDGERGEQAAHRPRTSVVERPGGDSNPHGFRTERARGVEAAPV